ncbi:MAG: carboxypeptidase regulatory-like domain-containing protein, partial [Terriglobia bacterium]
VIFATGASQLATLRALTAMPDVPWDQIVGFHMDEYLGIVPAVRIVVTNGATQTARTTSANASGNFSVPFLAPGRYNVRVSAHGFKTFLQNGVALGVAQTLSLSVALQLGATVQQVVVTGQTPLLQTTSTVLGQAINHQQINNLPLNGRNFLDLAGLAAGTANHEPGARDSSEGGFSSNGNRSQAPAAKRVA